MSATAASLSSVLRDRWTDDEIQQQWLQNDSILKRIEGFKATMIGQQAQTPVWGDLNSGGYTTTGAAGGSLNDATNQGSNQAVWTLIQQFFPISLEFSALNQSDDGMLSVISGKNQEIRGAIAVLRNQANRQLVTNADGKIAQCDTTSSSATVALIASPSGTAYGFDAIQRGWLRPGAVVDIGTTADTDSIVTATTVSAVAESSTAPTITIGSSVSTTSSDFVYIANPNSTTAGGPELNGLRNIINSSGAVGGLNPGTAGQEFWSAAKRDTSTSVMSLDLLLGLDTAVKMKNDGDDTETWMSLKQGQNFYSLLQNQVRFAGDIVGAGNRNKLTWANQVVSQFREILDSDVFVVTPKDLLRVTGRYDKPTWMTEVYGSNDRLQWNPGHTNGADAIGWAFQLGCRRRNGMAGATALTA